MEKVEPQDPLEKQVTQSFYSQTPLLGHNLTSTTDTPKAGQWLLGDYAIAYGVSDELMLGVNPWLVINYNMTAAGFKYGVDRGKYFQNFLDRISLEAYLFKTYQVLFDGYHQTSLFTRLSGTETLAPNYRLHGSLSFQYFFDSLSAFSLRPPTIGASPVTLAVGALHEIHVTENAGLFLEQGVLSLNSANRYIQIGLSGFYQQRWGYIQLGLSKSYPIGERLTGYPPAYWTDNHGGNHESVYYLFYAPVHPEIQIEFLL